MIYSWFDAWRVWGNQKVTSLKKKFKQLLRDIANIESLKESQNISWRISRITKNL